MKMLFLLFLTIPYVLSADPKCPTGYTYFKRVPTFKNNHTKHWCLGAFSYENMGNRDRARAFCIDQDAMLSIPESKKEFAVLEKSLIKTNISAPLVIDGQMSPRCKSRILQSQKSGPKFNATTEKGHCNVKKNLFSFDDINTDTSYVLSSFQFGPPNGYSNYQVDNGPNLRFVADGMVISEIARKFNRTSDKFVDVQYSMGKNVQKEYLTGERAKADGKIESVICGRRPL